MTTAQILIYDADALRKKLLQSIETIKNSERHVAYYLVTNEDKVNKMITIALKNPEKLVSSMMGALDWFCTILAKIRQNKQNIPTLNLIGNTAMNLAHDLIAFGEFDIAYDIYLELAKLDYTQAMLQLHLMLNNLSSWAKKKLGSNKDYYFESYRLLVRYNDRNRRKEVYPNESPSTILRTYEDEYTTLESRIKVLEAKNKILEDKLSYRPSIDGIPGGTGYRATKAKFEVAQKKEKREREEREEREEKEEKRERGLEKKS